MSLEKILNAESVAVVGASREENKRGYQAVKVLLDEKYEGRVYPVNPRERSILGLKCYDRIDAIEDSVDIALIATPAHTVPEILKGCGRKGVSGVVVLAGGFGEIGSTGRDLEKELVALARKYNIRVIGPNTSGMMNRKINLNLVGFHDTPRGDIALLTQSGNMALTLMTEAKLKSLKGFSYYVGVGNEADIQFHEYLEFFGNDPDTRAILMYVEGMRDGRKFLQQAHKTCPQKPIILLKSGRSSTGKRSVGSHTGALAGLSEVAQIAFRRAGIITIDNSDELFPAAETLASLPPIKNNRVAILADGGGHATIAADVLTDLGIELPELNPKTQQKLRALLPAAASVCNPVDVAGGTDADPGIFADCAKILLKDPQVGGLLIVGLFGGYGIRFTETLSLKEEDAAHRIGKMVRLQRKPIVMYSLFSSEKPHSLHLMRYYNVPVYDSLDVACKSISVLAEYGNYLGEYHLKTNFVLKWCHKAKPEGDRILQQALAEGRTALLETEAKRLLHLHGITVPRERLAQTADDAVKAATEFNCPLAMKIVSPDILHKSDANGVELNVASVSKVRSAFERIVANARRFDHKADVKGVLLTPMAPEGLEVIIGSKRDDQFGPVIMYGLGGIMVEILRDVSFRVLPISPANARKMIEETKSYPILKGIRGNPPGDKKALAKLLLSCSEIIEAYPQIQEMDLNPVIVHESGLSIVDARIILTSEPRASVSKNSST